LKSSGGSKFFLKIIAFSTSLCSFRLKAELQETKLSRLSSTGEVGLNLKAELQETKPA